MTKVSRAKTPNGEEIVMMPKAAYERMVREREDMEDLQATIEYLQSRLDGTLKLIPLAELEH